MFFEICMQIHSVVFAKVDKLTSKNMRKQLISCAQVLKVFEKYQAQGGCSTPNPPLRTPLHRPFQNFYGNYHVSLTILTLFKCVQLESTFSPFEVA